MTGKITTDELVAMFGPTIPMDAYALLQTAPDDVGVDRVREMLLEIKAEMDRDGVNISDETKQRADGFYWVLTRKRWEHNSDFQPEWLLAEWEAGDWALPGMDGSDYPDSAMIEIDERRIERELPATPKEGASPNGTETQRRNDVSRLTLPERAIYEAMLCVELAGADARLTEAARLLGEAKGLVADFVDGVPRPPMFGAVVTGPNPLAGIPHTMNVEGDDLVVRLPLQGFGGVPMLSDVLALLYVRANEVSQQVGTPRGMYEAGLISLGEVADRFGMNAARECVGLPPYREPPTEPAAASSPPA